MTEAFSRGNLQERLGYLYRDAPEPMQDLEKALHSFQKAVELGDKPAQAALSHLEKRMPAPVSKTK